MSFYILQNKFLVTITIMLTLILAGCGFHLKNSYLIPPELNKLNFESNDEYSEISRFVKDKLTQQNVLLSDESNIPILSIKEDKLNRHILSLYGNGNVAEYGLIYTVIYSITMLKQDPQIMKVEIRRDYLDDPSTALAKNREMGILLKEMRIEASDKIISSLSRVKIDASISK